MDTNLSIFKERFDCHNKHCTISAKSQLNFHEGTCTMSIAVNTEGMVLYEPINASINRDSTLNRHMLVFTNTKLNCTTDKVHSWCYVAYIVLQSCETTNRKTENIQKRSIYTEG